MKASIIIGRYNLLLIKLRKATESNFAGTWQQQIEANTGPWFGPNAAEIWRKNCDRKIHEKQKWIDAQIKKLKNYRKQLNLPERPLDIISEVEAFKISKQMELKNE